MKSGATTTVDRVGALIRAVSQLSEKRVLVGIPAESAERDGPINNAALGYIHETGSPERNIPARPFLVPGVQNALPSAERYLRRASDEMLAGQSTKADASLAAAGITAVSAVRNKISSGEFEPLADATLRARARRGGSGLGARAGAQAELDSRQLGNDPGTSLAKPLIDTGSMLAHITYVVRSK